MRAVWIGLVVWLLGVSSTVSAPAPAPAWVAAARAQVGITLYYDPAYVRLGYPGGDPPSDRGVCTDVLIRALRSVGLDLQQRVHEDMRNAFDVYPQRWGLRRPDRNIDHRRVPNLETWMRRQGWSLDDTDPQAGDMITWMLPGNLPHIGIVSDQFDETGQRPLILHNVGAGTQEEDVLEQWPRVAHFRPRLQPAAQQSHSP